MPVECLHDAIDGYRLLGRDVGERAVDRTFEEVVAEAFGYRSATGDFGMAFARRVPAALAAYPPLVPDENTGTTHRSIPHAPSVASMTDHFGRIASGTSDAESGDDVDLEMVVNDTASEDFETFKIERDFDTIDHRGLSLLSA
jgi:hypothetical protein